jgi:sugar phosphate isomerase/epimerase
MKPRFACADFTFPLLSHDKVLALISLLGFDGVDIGLFEDRSHLMPSDVFKDTKGNAKKLKSKLDENGLVAADIFLQTALDFDSTAVNHPDKKIRQYSREMFLNTLEFCHYCEGRHISGLPGVYFDGENEEDSFKRCCEELEWRCEQAALEGVTFSVEAHIGSVIPDPPKALELVSKVKGLTLTLDYTHFTRIGIPDDEIEPLVAHASHFHARGAALGRLQTSVKENSIDYAGIVREMIRTEYKGFVGIEYIWMDWEDCNRVDNVSESILLKELIEKAFLDSEV